MRPSSVTLTFLLLFAGCGEKMDPTQVIDLAGFQDFASLGDSAQGGISYQTVRPILDQRCFACHASTVQGGARQGAPVGVDYDTYAKAKAHGPSGNAWIQGGGMPPGAPMPAQERALFQAWIDAGMPEFGQSNPDTDTTTPPQDVSTEGKVTYYALYPLLETHCLACHSSKVAGLARQGAPRGVDYDTYLLAVKYASSGNAWVQDGGMPPAAPLSATEKALFQAWLDDGVLQGSPEDAEAAR